MNLPDDLKLILKEREDAFQIIDDSEAALLLALVVGGAFVFDLLRRLVEWMWA